MFLLVFWLSILKINLLKDGELPELVWGNALIYDIFFTKVYGSFLVSCGILVKYHELFGLNNTYLFVRVLIAGSPRPRASLFPDECPLPGLEMVAFSLSSSGEERTPVSPPIFYLPIFVLISVVMIPLQGPHLQIPSPWEEASCMNLGECS